jgi:hypothetical protein
LLHFKQQSKRTYFTLRPNPIVIDIKPYIPRADSISDVNLPDWTWNDHQHEGRGTKMVSPIGMARIVLKRQGDR